MLSLDGGNTPPITREDLSRGNKAPVYDLHNIRRSAGGGKKTGRERPSKGRTFGRW